MIKRKNQPSGWFFYGYYLSLYHDYLLLIFYAHLLIKPNLFGLTAMPIVLDREMYLLT
ncbi:hypothetical protein AC596_19910 [Yersinia pestis subsp. microtus bv. Hissarica]|nr:hypothetical protein AC596_19910 [Yersinia pestis subsp. microtus bv. Hissarica]PCN67834.1 hypothetical protein A8V19_19780 [Yersinia pestis]